MAFNSFSFWLVFPLIFGAYWLIPAKYNPLRKVFLIVVSYLLYMNWRPAFAIVLFSITLLTYWGGLLFMNPSDEGDKKRKKLVWLMTILALLPLIVFKYYSFLNENIYLVLSAFGLHFTLQGLNLAIPVGISFFSFQAIGYMLDVYHGKTAAEKNFIDYMLFVSFFPQITSGPISTANELLPQIKAAHKFSYNQGRDGLKLLLWGMFIKLVIADRAGMFVDTVYGNYQNYSGNTCLLASLLYTIQIYCDFAGYSWMAMGIAKTLGFNLINNFRQPYLATSITDFWHRWHISLTRWLTSHVYIAMGGSRCSKIKQYWNIIVTFLVSGLWHGANWTFVFWGVIHGVAQIIEKVLGLAPKGKRANSRTHCFSPIKIVFTFLLVSFAWVFFRMPTIEDAFHIIWHMIIDRGQLIVAGIFNGTAPVVILITGILILVLKDVFNEFETARIRFIYKPMFQWASYIALFVMLIATGVLDGGQFIYANF